jgi:hypothetical protein
MADDLQEGESLANLRIRQGFAKGPNDSGMEPVGSGGAGRMGQEAIADYAEWVAGGGGGGDRVASARGAVAAAVDGSAGARQREKPVARDEADAWQSSGLIAEGSDPRERIWKARASSPVVAPADVSIADGRTTWPARGTAGFSPSQTDPESRSGVASTGAIERLLREQNELIRQDLQRNANPPIAAPPPMRGGGIRM